MTRSPQPAYRPVVFRDQAAETTFLTRSTAVTDRTIVWEDGNEYPLVNVEVSSASHPFFTGQARIVDTAGRVQRFEQRYGTRRAQAPVRSGRARGTMR